MMSCEETWLLARHVREAAPDAALEVSRSGEDIVIELPEKAPDPMVSVVVLEIEGEPAVGEALTAQADDRSLTLRARDAMPHGSNIKYEEGGGKDNIGFWTDPNDYVTWVLRISNAAEFDVEITYACTAPGGSTYVVEVGDQRLEAKVQATGGWTDFQPRKLGRMKLSADRHTLTVRAKDLKSEGVMNLKSIVFTPVK